MYTTKEIEAGLARYAEEELDIVRARSKQAARMRSNGATVRQIIHFMFDVEDNPPDHAPLLGNPGRSIGLSARSALTLWPKRNVTSENVNGIAINDLEEFISNGTIIPLIQNPDAYQDISLIAGLIIDHHPPSYFWRGNMVYSILAGGDENFEHVGSSIMSGPLVDWYKKALGLDIIKRSHLYRSSWEPHHQGKIGLRPDKWEQKYLRESFSFKYVNACTFLGQSFVDTIVDDYPADKALKFLTTFHILTDHPMSHALLTNATVDMSSQEWELFSRGKHDYYCSNNLSDEMASLPLMIWAKPRYNW